VDLYLVRHTRVDVASGLCYGRTEVPVAASFEDEADALRALLPPSLDVVWTSPALRCRRLAQRLDTATARCDGRLAELDFGAWEGLRWGAIDARLSRAWTRDFLAVAAPGGECGNDLLRRVDEWRSEALSEPAAAVAVVSHGGPIRALLCRWLELPARCMFTLKIEPSTVSLVRLGATGARVVYCGRHG
jgi:alpha-ribazole phosphatase